MKSEERASAGDRTLDSAMERNPYAAPRAPLERRGGDSRRRFTFFAMIALYWTLGSFYLGLALLRGYGVAAVWMQMQEGWTFGLSPHPAFALPTIVLRLCAALSLFARHRWAVQVFVALLLWEIGIGLLFGTLRYGAIELVIHGCVLAFLIRQRIKGKLR